MPTDRRGHTKRDETPLGLRRRETRPGQARGASEPHTRRAGGVPGLGGVGGAFQGTECQCGGWEVLEEGGGGDATEWTRENGYGGQFYV